MRTYDTSEYPEAILVQEPPVVLTEALQPDDIYLPLPRRTVFGFFFGVVRSIFGGICSGVEGLFGIACLIFGLAVLAALPIFQFLSLGYLLEAGGRVARTGRLRDAFFGIRMAARIGGAVLGCWLTLLPLRFVSGLTRAAQIIDPDGPAANGWRAALMVVIPLTAFHLLATLARGGRLRLFFWPFNLLWLVRQLWRGGYYSRTRDASWDVLVGLRLPYFFWLGFRGFASALVWLIIPVSLIALGRAVPALGFIGAILLAWVLFYLPFLQVRLAAQNRFRAGFERKAVRAEFTRAPWAFAFAFLVTLLTALPLYLLKIELVPAEAAWLPSLVFIAFIFPARVLTGWALGRANRREQPRHWFFRWTGRLALVPVVLFYVTVVYFTQFTSWNGIWSLYEQHAFLVPVPFFGL